MNNATQGRPDRLRILKLRAALRDVITLGSPVADQLRVTLRETNVEKRGERR